MPAPQKRRRAPLSAKARTLHARIRSLAQQGYSGRASLARLRSIDKHISDAAFWNARQQVLSYQKAGRSYKYSGIAYKMAARDFPENEFTQRGKYHYIVRMDGVTYPGKKLPLFMTIYSNEPRSKGWVLERAWASLEDIEKLYEFIDPDKVQLVIVEVYGKPRRAQTSLAKGKQRW